MHRVRGLLVLALLLIPTVSHAIQLHWSSGADTLTFTEATRAILLLRADSAEVTLPSEWRLLWVGDSTEVEVVALDSLEVCAGDTAQVYGLDGPATPADSAAHLMTAHFCSGGSAAAEQAVFQLDLPAWGRGKCKVVALDPADSTSVLESNEVTFNGGVADEFAPALLAASSTHESCTLEVTAVGVGLSTVTSLTLGAADGLWRLPLTITSLADTVLTAVADVPTALPAATLQTGASTGASALAPVAADDIGTFDAILPDTVLFRDPDWATNWYPKDFSFFYNVVPTGNSAKPWKGLFHLMYIRARHGANGSDSTLAHAWSEDLTHWRVDVHAFAPRHNGGWEDKAIWAPTLLQVGDSTVMFYTGVDPSNNQRIGYAKVGMLDTTDTNPNWQRQSSWVFSADSATSWADASGAGYGGAQQFRDPFVMEDPDSTGRYLMFVTGEDKRFGSAGRMVVGVARNRPGTMARWMNGGAYFATDYTHTSITVLESPLVCRDSSDTGAWRIFMTNGYYNNQGSNSQYFITELPDSSLTNTALDCWPDLDNMYTYLGSDGSLLGWAACEHLRVGRSDFFAGYNGDGIAITQAHWDTTTGNFVIGYPSLAGAPSGSPVSDVRFYLSQCRPGEPSVRFGVDLPGLVSPRLVVYDIAGRRVRTLADGQALQGHREFHWDCRDSRGTPVASGVYFARLTEAGAPQVLHVPVVR